MSKRWTSTPEHRGLVTGATGMVGQALIAQLGGHVVATSRRPDLRTPQSHPVELLAWDGVSALDARALTDVDAVFHLAGEPVVEGRWNAAKKERILRSRVDSTRALVRSIAAAPKRPRVLVCASAVGYYGSCGDAVLTETSAPGDGFLPEVCLGWEEEAAKAGELGVRVVSLRIGIVLSTAGGALARLAPLFRAGLGSRLGDGKQWMPWIHIDDLVGLLRFAAASDAVAGPMNAVAPGIIDNATFTRALARRLHRPALLPAPAFALKLALGEAANVVLASQRVEPAVAREAGYSFAYPTLESALVELFPERPAAHASPVTP